MNKVITQWRENIHVNGGSSVLDPEQGNCTLLRRCGDAVERSLAAGRGLSVSAVLLL